MILVHYKDGLTRKLDPLSEAELVLLDSPREQVNISRVAILDDNGHRVDLPSVTNRTSRVWIELVSSSDIPKGERVCMRFGNRLLKATLYYSDSRVVIDL